MYPIHQDSQIDNFQNNALVTLPYVFIDTISECNFSGTFDWQLHYSFFSFFCNIQSGYLRHFFPKKFRNAFFCGRFIFCNCNKKYPLATKSTLNPSILESLLEKRILCSVLEVLFEPYFNRTFLCYLRIQPNVRSNKSNKSIQKFCNEKIIDNKQLLTRNCQKKMVCEDSIVTFLFDKKSRKKTTDLKTE